MNTKIILLPALMLLVAGCHNDRDMPREYVEYADVVEYDTNDCSTAPASPDTAPGRVKYSVPRDGDLTLETRHHVIQIQGQPGTDYSYYVWTGDKTYNDDPDMIVDNGNVMILQEN